MQKIKVLILGFTFCILSFEFAFATATTHIWAPSTDVQAYKKWHITSDFYVPVESDAAGNRPNTITNLGLTIGVLPFDKLNAEVGFDHKSGYGALDDYPFYFNTKVGIPEGAYGELFPALAAGIYDVGTREDKTDYNVFYVKAAKTLTLAEGFFNLRFCPVDKGFSLGRISVGYFSGNDKLLLNGEKKDNDGVLLAWERSVPEISDKLWVALEYQGSRSSYGTWNAGFSWKFSDNTSMIFGYDIYNDRDLADTFTVQLDIDF